MDATNNKGDNMDYNKAIKLVKEIENNFPVDGEYYDSTQCAYVGGFGNLDDSYQYCGEGCQPSNSFAVSAADLNGVPINEIADQMIEFFG